jgi:hypothetical protein
VKTVNDHVNRHLAMGRSWTTLPLICIKLR